MRLSPLVIHAAIQIPRYTARFSDALAVSTMVVTEGDNVVLTAAGHGLTVGSQVAISITASPTPNVITAAEIDAAGNIVLTTDDPHDLTGTPDSNVWPSWQQTVALSGFASSSVNGNRQLISVTDANTFTIAPGSSLGSITLTGNEVLLEDLEDDIIGWHAATVTSSSQLTFPTPSTVGRTYTVANPTVVTSIRCYGAVSVEQALAHCTPEDGASIDKAHLFILPLPSVRTSRSGQSRTDLLAELSPSVDARQIMMDGFVVLVLIPGQQTAAHVRAVDLCNGEIFKAVLKTFRGLKMPRPELSAGGSYTAILESHTGDLANRALYGHRYDFQCPAYLTNDDGIAPFDWPYLDPDAVGTGDTPTGDDASISTTGTFAFRELDFTSILHSGHPQPLTASVDTGEDD